MKQTWLVTLTLAGASAAWVGLAGCQVAKSSLQMDSDSRAPFFGLQLVPKKKTAEPKVSSANRSRTQETKTKAANYERREKAVQRSAWSRWFGRFGKPKRIPLPITDPEPDEEASVSGNETADDLAAF